MGACSTGWHGAGGSKMSEAVVTFPGCNSRVVVGRQSAPHPSPHSVLIAIWEVSSEELVQLWLGNLWRGARALGALALAALTH